MRPSLFSLGRVMAAMAVIGFAVLAPAQYYISEVIINPPGTDTGVEWIELRGPASGTIPADTWLIVLEGGAAGAGDVDQGINLGGLTLGSNGFLVLRHANASFPYSISGSATTVTMTGTTAGTSWDSAISFGPDIENGSIAFFLVNLNGEAAPTTANDYDSDNDGTLDSGAQNWIVHDSIGIVDTANDRGYASLIFFENTLTSTFNPGGATTHQLGWSEVEFIGRYLDSTGAGVGDWFLGDVTGTVPGALLANTGETLPASAEGSDITTSLGSSNANLPVELSQFQID